MRNFSPTYADPKRFEPSTLAVLTDMKTILKFWVLRSCVLFATFLVAPNGVSAQDVSTQDVSAQDVGNQDELQRPRLRMILPPTRPSMLGRLTFPWRRPYGRWRQRCHNRIVHESCFLTFPVPAGRTSWNGFPPKRICHFRSIVRLPERSISVTPLDRTASRKRWIS